MSAELLLGRYISSLLVGLLRKTMNFFSVACLQLLEGIVLCVSLHCKTIDSALCLYTRSMCCFPLKQDILTVSYPPLYYLWVN